MKTGKKIVVLVHMGRFDNSRTIRHLPFGGIHAWAIAQDDVAGFCKVYADGKPSVVVAPEGAVLWAVDFEEVDAFVCGRSAVVPERVAFDPKIHTVTADVETVMCWCGCGEDDGMRVWYDNPYQVIIEVPGMESKPEMRYGYASWDDFGQDADRIPGDYGVYEATDINDPVQVVAFPTSDERRWQYNFTGTAAERRTAWWE